MSMPAKSTSTRAGAKPLVVTSTSNGLTMGTGRVPIASSTAPPDGSVTAHAWRCRLQAGSGCTTTSALGRRSGDSL